MTYMTGFRKAVFVAFACQLATSMAVAAPGCTASSGGKKTALVELYTSEGCSSCPPADAWIGNIYGRYRSDQLVSLALHVPYWDDLGWKDGFSQTAFAQRQSWLVGLNGHRTVYTPHFFVSGAEVANWSRSLDAEVRRINASPATAHISVSASVSRNDKLAVATEAATSVSGDGQQLFLAVIEDGLTSEIRAGENRGTVMHHDHVVRALIGPLTMPGGKSTDRREVSIEPVWHVARLGIVAFIQDGRTGEVLQATSCALGRKP